ncbi:hypothetical protein TSAR_016108 [Trichomalopsis sarcophagae]|uniref:Uncharacterized protein n=1 Tax=Trichomalopsis sarcophagae TaxID=543379 RepID=A0A232EV82_9HYME|nr:hypothetical protein TSAR_016108 [Trichomalopsis sarcophagae]
MVALGIPQKSSESISTDVEQGKPWEPQNTEVTQINEARQNNYADYSGANFNQVTRTLSLNSLQYGHEKEEKICFKITIIIIAMLFIICIILNATLSGHGSSGSNSSYSGGHSMTYSNNYWIYSANSIYGRSRSRSSSTSIHGSSSHSGRRGGGRSGGGGGRRG